MSKKPAAPTAPQAENVKEVDVVEEVTEEVTEAPAEEEKAVEEKPVKLDMKNRELCKVKSPFLLPCNGKEYLTGSEAPVLKTKIEDYRQRGLIH